MAALRCRVLPEGTSLEHAVRRPWLRLFIVIEGSRDIKRFPVVCLECFGVVNLSQSPLYLAWVCVWSVELLVLLWCVFVSIGSVMVALYIKLGKPYWYRGRRRNCKVLALTS